MRRDYTRRDRRNDRIVAVALVVGMLGLLGVVVWALLTINALLVGVSPS